MPPCSVVVVRNHEHFSLDGFWYADMFEVSGEGTKQISGTDSDEPKMVIASFLTKNLLSQQGHPRQQAENKEQCV